ncbi:MAG: hypothetical protein WAM14_18605 [Candidatus Nitrosopolaris sp.]
MVNWLILSICVAVLLDSMTKQPIHTCLTIIGIVAALTFVMTSTITPVFAIKNFFNCMTDIANEHGKLTMDDANMCLHKEYHVYRNGP